MIAQVRLSGRSDQGRQPPSIDIALKDPNLLGAALGSTDSWQTWLTALRAAYGLPLDEQRRETFAKIAGGRPPPKRKVRELWCVIGARAGKTRIAAMNAAYTATLQPHRLAPGEIGHVLTISPTRDQASLVSNYAQEFIACSPLLTNELEGDPTATEIRLRNGVVIGTHPCSFRSVRGRTLLACILDEVAYFRDESSAVPDREVYRAVMPRLVKDGMLIGISTGYRRAGLLYDKYRNHFGVDDPDVLVVSGSTMQFNPTFHAATIEKSQRDDPEAASEWTGGFRSDIANFLDDADIEACIDHDRPLELPPRRGTAYRAFCDSSGGRHDAFTISIGHVEGQRVVIDVVRGAVPPFDPAQVVSEHAALLREYGLNKITGDNFAAEWVATAYRESGIRYIRCELPKGRLYIENLPAFTRRIVSMPDHPRLVRELRLLERRTHIGGKDTVDHGRTGSDDHANAVVGVLHHCLRRRQQLRMGTYDFNGPPGCEIDPVTGRPLDPREHTRIRWVTIPESSAPAVKGPY